MAIVEQHSRLLAAHLRTLARQIENVSRESPVHSNAWKAVSMCSDLLQAEARVIEVNAELEEQRASARSYVRKTSKRRGARKKR